MKIKNIHITLLLLIVGIFSVQSIEFDSFSTNLSLETKIEETLDNSKECDFEKQLTDSDSDGGGNTIFSNQNLIFVNPFVAKSNLANNPSKDLAQKLPLFILYCCLKLDC